MTDVPFDRDRIKRRLADAGKFRMITSAAYVEDVTACLAEIGRLTGPPPQGARSAPDVSRGRALERLPRSVRRRAE